MYELVKDYMYHSMHAQLEAFFGEFVYYLLIGILSLLAVLLLVASISNSNVLFGNPEKRSPMLTSLQYHKTRTMGRIVLGFISVIVLFFAITLL